MIMGSGVVLRTGKDVISGVLTVRTVYYHWAFLINDALHIT